MRNSEGISDVKEQIGLTKGKIFEAVTLTLHTHYIHVSTVSKVINTENKICLPNKGYTSGH